MLAGWQCLLAVSVLVHYQLGLGSQLQHPLQQCRHPASQSQCQHQSTHPALGSALRENSADLR
ncbi:hypothetical protein SMALB_5663 [Streptomyces malaysiensis]|uniref:Uncharacterized protein n=1 Tax=Streptomyces malaysiensis TaxID=92644 RepID=A0A7X5X6P0_STRMQ|nr:hypothetical protein [Streptomyces malaysiensis]